MKIETNNIIKVLNYFSAPQLLNMILNHLIIDEISVLKNIEKASIKRIGNQCNESF